MPKPNPKKVDDGTNYMRMMLARSVEISNAKVDKLLPKYDKAREKEYKLLNANKPAELRKANKKANDIGGKIFDANKAREDVQGVQNAFDTDGKFHKEWVMGEGPNKLIKPSPSVQAMLDAKKKKKGGK